MLIPLASDAFICHFDILHHHFIIRLLPAEFGKHIAADRMDLSRIVDITDFISQVAEHKPVQCLQLCLFFRRARICPRRLLLLSIGCGYWQGRSKIDTKIVFLWYPLSRAAKLSLIQKRPCCYYSPLLFAN